MKVSSNKEAALFKQLRHNVMIHETLPLSQNWETLQWSGKNSTHLRFATRPRTFRPNSRPVPASDWSMRNNTGLSLADKDVFSVPQSRFSRQIFFEFITWTINLQSSKIEIFICQIFICQSNVNIEIDTGLG